MGVSVDLTWRVYVKMYLLTRVDCNAGIWNFAISDEISHLGFSTCGEMFSSVLYVRLLL